MRAFSSEEIRSFLRADLPSCRAVPREEGLPKISVITPSFNQARFLERTLRSVLNQRYPNLEFLVIDGGSTDGSVEILRRYGERLTCWISEPDRGQSEAINKGFRMATGDLVAWQNSDDIYLPGAFWKIADAWRRHPGEDVYFGNMLTVDEYENVLDELRYTPFSVDGLLYDGWNITNQSAFFSRGSVCRDPFALEYRYAMDGDFFVRLGLAGSRFRFIRAPLGALRIHSKAKGETIGNTVGVDEWVEIRAKAGIRMRRDIPWSRQYRFRKTLHKTRKLLWYVLQGDFDYIARKASRSVRGGVR